MENEQLIMNKLDVLSVEINSLRECLLDMTLTPDDLDSIEEAERDLSEGRTKRL